MSDGEILHWQIRRLRVIDGVVTEAEPVAEVRAAGGEGSLAVLDEKFRETLEELFTEEQVAFTDRVVEEGGLFETTLAEVLEPWQPETLEYVRNLLSRHGLTAVDV